MKMFWLLIICSVFLLLSACTYSINMVHSQGQSTDAVDETSSATPDISPTITIPPTALGL